MMSSTPLSSRVRWPEMAAMGEGGEAAEEVKLEEAARVVGMDRGGGMGGIENGGNIWVGTIRGAVTGKGDTLLLF